MGARCGDSRLVAVLHHEVFVNGGVRYGVHGRAPAVGDVTVGVHEPARERMELVLVVNLVVDEHQLLVDLDRHDLRIGEAHLVGIERLHLLIGVAALLRHARGGVVAVVEHGDRRDVRDVLHAEHDGREHVRAALGRAVVGVEAIPFKRLEVGSVLLERVNLSVVERHDGVRARRQGAGHEVAVYVLFGLRGLLQRVHPAHHLPEVTHAVAVGIPVDGVGAHGEFLEVGEAVVVGVALGDVLSRLHGRVERLHDVLGRKPRALRDVVQRELLAGQLHPLVVLHLADCGTIPEVVLVAVGEAVVIGIPQRRVGALLRDPAVVLVERIRKGGLPLCELGGVVGVVRRDGCLEVGPCRHGAVPLDFVPEGDGVRLGLGEVRIGHPLAAHEEVQAVGIGAVVEALVEAADFHLRVKRNAQG